MKQGYRRRINVGRTRGVLRPSTSNFFYRCLLRCCKERGVGGEAAVGIYLGCVGALNCSNTTLRTL